MNLQNHDDEDANDEEGVQFLLCKISGRPSDEFLHSCRSFKRGYGFEDDAKALAVRPEGFDLTRELLVLAAMSRVLRAVFQQLGMPLLDVIFSQGNLSRGSEYKLHQRQRHLLTLRVRPALLNYGEARISIVYAVSASLAAGQAMTLHLRLGSTPTRSMPFRFCDCE